MTQRDAVEACLSDLRKREMGSAEWLKAVWLLEIVLRGIEKEGDGTVDEARECLARDIVQISYECLGVHTQYSSLDNVVTIDS